MELIIKFEKTRSPYFGKALDMVRAWNPSAAAEDRPGSWVVTFRDRNVFEAEKLWNTVKKWKTARAELNGRPIRKIPFYRVLGCYSPDADDSHCFDRNDGGDNYLFGCHYLYLKYARHWWSFGRLDGSKWIIDKKALLKCIKKVIIEDSLDLCPAFSFARVDRVILNLPYSIDTKTDDEWEVENGWRWGRYGPISVQPVRIPYRIKSMNMPVYSERPDLLPTPYDPDFARRNTP